MVDGGSVVTNSGPLIGLGCIGQLELLEPLDGSVLVPDAVWREVVDEGEARAAAADLADAPWATREVLTTPPDPLLADELGSGESEAIALAVQRQARLLLLDDRRARRIAEVAYGLRVKGAAGILVSAKREGLVERVQPLLESMRDEGYFLSDRVIAAARRAAGE